MKSKITVDVDYDNQPVIKIQYVDTEDIRDKLVKRFLESFGSSCVAEFKFINDNASSLYDANKIAFIRGVPFENIGRFQFDMEVPSPESK